MDKLETLVEPNAAAVHDREVVTINKDGSVELELSEGDVDKILLYKRGSSETPLELWVYQSEDDPLIVAKLTPAEIDRMIQILNAMKK